MIHLLNGPVVKLIIKFSPEIQVIIPPWTKTRLDKSYHDMAHLFRNVITNDTKKRVVLTAIRLSK
jgi:hypothetical protein